MRWTDGQLEVINYNGGHAKVIAVAGSGKSTVLVERIVRLIQDGTPAERIGVFMFNDSASNSFKQKLKARLRLPAKKTPKTSTFHSLANRICKDLTSCGALPNFKLETDQRVQLKLAKATLLKVTRDKPSNELVEAFTSFVGIVKSDIISARDKLPEMDDLTGKPSPAYFPEAFDEFERQRHSLGVRFFADLLYDAHNAMAKQPSLQAAMCLNVDHLLIDEYQDITEIQQSLITMIAGNAKVMVVGDVDQAIYDWAGARPEYLESLFEVDFPQAKTFFLNFTFRFGHEISLLSNAVIANNPRRLDYCCLSHGSTPRTRVTSECESPDGSEVARLVQEWISQGGRYSDVAILVRLHACSAGPEIGMLSAGIPYKTASSETVLDRRETRMVIGYLRSAIGRLGAADPAGVAGAKYLEAMLTCPSLPVHSDVISGLATRLASSGRDLLTIAEHSLASEGLEDWVCVKVRSRLKTIQEATAVSGASDAADFLECVYQDVDLFAQLRRASYSVEAANDKVALLTTLQELVRGMSIKQAVSFFDDFLARASKMKFEAGATKNAVTIHSAHASKGLEWPLVIIPGLREGLFPADTKDSATRLHAERRLFYVACTRAVQRLHLLHPHDTDLDEANQAGLGSVPDGARSVASRFLFESNPSMAVAGANAVYDGYGVVQGANTAHVARYALDLALNIDVKRIPYSPSKGRLVSGPNTPFKAEKGMEVEHEEHGRGTVVAVYPRAGTHSMEVKMHSGKTRVFVAHVAELRQV